MKKLLWEQEVAGSNPATPTKEKALQNLQGFFYEVKSGSPAFHGIKFHIIFSY
jgi:hypothetical protein